ncbi:MAG: PHP domain-containing protein [Arenicellales bacterium]
MIDLHTHSTASDGTLSPTELVQHAASAGIRHLALTDHDSVSGINEAQAAADQLGIQLIHGLELSVTWSKRTLHIVALNVDIHNVKLNAALTEVLTARQSRAQFMAERLAQHGIEGALEGAQRHAKSTLIGRLHFAKFLVETGHAKDIRQVFKRFLVQGKPGYVSGQWMPLEEGVELIHQAGGIAIIAHPARYKLSRTKLRGLFSEFKALGGNAIEVISGSQSKDENHAMALHALDFDLPASQGSDFHGPEKPWVQLGHMPEMYYRCQPVWQNTEGRLTF